MPIIIDGSRLCNFARQPLAGIDTSITLSSKSDPFIVACGLAVVDGGPALDGGSGDTLAWYWRRYQGGAGTWDFVGEEGEVKFANGTFLTPGGSLLNADKVCSQSFTPVNGAIGEYHQVFGPMTVIGTVNDTEGAESQIAVNVYDAIPGEVYQLKLQCINNGGFDIYDLECAAKFTVPIIF